MSCLGAIGKLFLVLVVVAALLVVGVIVLAAFQAAKQPSHGEQRDAGPVVATEDRPTVSLQQQAPPPPPPLPAPPPPSVEERINQASERLGRLSAKARDALQASTSSPDPESALRQVTVDLESVADGPDGANAIAKQLKEELFQISDKTKAIRANMLLSSSDKNELVKTLSAQQAVIQKAVTDADSFCRALRTIQTNDIPAWTSAYSQFANILGAPEALKRISPRIKAVVDKFEQGKKDKR